MAEPVDNIIYLNYQILSGNQSGLDILIGNDENVNKNNYEIKLD